MTSQVCGHSQQRRNKVDKTLFPLSIFYSSGLDVGSLLFLRHCKHPVVALSHFLLDFSHLKVSTKLKTSTHHPQRHELASIVRTTRSKFFLEQVCIAHGALLLMRCRPVADP